MTSYSFIPSAEELKLLSQVGEKLASHSDELAAGMQDVLEANAAFHEQFFSLEELSQVSHRCAERLVEALRRGEMYSMPETIREQGAQFAQKGLGDRSLVDSVSAWQTLCLPLMMRLHEIQQREQALIVTAKALSRYAALFTEGFLTASRDRILYRTT